MESYALSKAYTVNIASGFFDLGSTWTIPKDTKFYVKIFNMSNYAQEIDIRAIHLYELENEVPKLPTNLNQSTNISSFISNGNLSANFKMDTEDFQNVISIAIDGSLIIDFGSRNRIKEIIMVAESSI